MLFYFQNHKAGTRFYAQSAECSCHWSRVDELNIVQSAIFQFMSMTRNKELGSKLDCLVTKSLLVSPGNNLMTMDDSNFEPCHFYKFVIREIFDGFVFKITLHYVYIVGKWFDPIMYLSTAEVACANNCINFVGGDHLSVLWGHFGGPVWDVEVSEHQHQHTHLFLLCHLDLLIFYKYIKMPLLWHRI